LTGSHGIWMGRAEIRISDDTDLEGVDPGPAYVNALGCAESQEAFLDALESWSTEHDIELVEVEASAPLHEMLNADEDILNAAFDAAEYNEIAAVFYVLEDPSMWDEDPDADILHASAGRRDLVQFRFMGTDDWMTGFVIGVSDDWTLLHVLDDRRAVLDGYAAVRLDKVIEAEVVEDEDFFVGRALAAAGVGPSDPGISIRDHASILSSVRERFPLVRLSEEGEADADYVGQIEDVGVDAVTIEGVSRGGEWVGTERYEYRDVITIEFGRAYEDALARVVGASTHQGA
jgi:hypothetical protein